MAQLRITEFDTIPLPADDARKKLPIARTIYDHPAWPNRQFTCFFDWNEPAERWIWRVELDGYSDEHGPIVGPAPAQYAHDYRFRGYITFVFMDLSRHEEHVTPTNLGDEVSLVALPGPQSPGYADWYDRQRELSDEDEQSAEVNH